MTSLVWRAQLRLSMDHPLVTALHIAAVALAVAVLFATAITRQSSAASLELAAQGLAGGSDAQLLAPGGIHVQQYAELRRAWLSRYPGLQLHPVLEGRVRIGDRFHVVTGIDPLASPALLATASALIGRHTAVIGRRDADRLGLSRGSALPLTDGAGASLTVGAVLESDALAGRLLVDLATARRLLNRPDFSLDRIDVQLPGGAADEMLATRLRAELEGLAPALSWIDSGDQLSGQRQLIEAFEFNLEALSVLALAVAGLMLASAAQFSFRHRRPLLQRLRELGVSPARLWRLSMAEALLLTVAGGIAGWGLGALLSLILQPLAAASVEALYGTDAILRFSPDIRDYIRPVLLSGLLLCGIQSWQLWRRRRTGNAVALRRALAVLSAVGAAVCLRLPGLETAYLAVFGTAASLLLLLPDALRGLLQLGRRLHWQRAPLIRLGMRDAARMPPHLALAAAALCLALAASLAVSLMAGSLQRAVQDWLAQQLAADLYLPLPDPGAAAAQARYWQQQPDVDQVSISLRHDWPLAGQRVTIEGLDPVGAAHLQLLDCPPGCLRRWDQGALLVSEPLARHRNLKAGDMFSLPDASGEKHWRIAGIVRDFDPGGGRLIMPLQAYTESGYRPARASLGLFLDSAAEPDELQRAARQAGLAPVERRQIQHNVDTLFASTFAVTDWLRLTVMAIALLAVAAGLSLQALQQRPQLAVLRALGATPAANGAWLATQALGTALGAALWAIPLGYALAWLLVHEINPRAFGWSLSLQPQPGLAVAILPMAALAALLALPYPCWQLLRISQREGVAFAAGQNLRPD